MNTKHLAELRLKVSAEDAYAQIIHTAANVATAAYKHKE
jgi:hypothetical protein|tara:strand:+ start:841 stop:957 length:117 start_codon:yes stop_codon:yes gene_type:complete